MARRYAFDERLPNGRTLQEELGGIGDRPGERLRGVMDNPNGSMPPALSRPLALLSAVADTPSGPPFLSAGEAAPTSSPLPMPVEPAAVAPMPLPSAPLGAVEPMVDPSGMMRPPRLTSPTMGDTGNRLSDLREYGAELGAYKPQNNNSRLKSFLIGLGRGALQGFGRAGIGGALGGAAMGGITHGIDPSSDEKYHRLGEIQRTQQEIVGLGKQSDLDLERRKTEAGIAHTEAQTRALGQPKAVEPKLFQGADGLQYEYDRESRTARPVPGQGPKGANAKVLRTVERGGKVWYETEEGLRPAVDPQTGEQLKQDLVDVTTSDGRTLKVSPSTAVMADATARRESRQATRDEIEDARREEERQRREEDQQFQRSTARFEDAERAVTRLQEAIEATNKAANLVNNPPGDASEVDKKAYKNAFDAALQRANQLGLSVRQNYGDFVEDDRDTKLPTILKGRPTAQSPAPAPARPSKRPAAVRGRTPARKPASDPLGLYR